MKIVLSLIAFVIVVSLNPSVQAQTKKRYVTKTRKINKKKRVVKRVKKVRIFRSPLDLMFIPKFRKFIVSAGVESDTSTYLDDSIVGIPTIISSQETTEKRTQGFVSFDYSIMKNLVIGAKFSHSFVNTLNFENARNTNSSPFTQFEEDNAGFNDPQLTALYRLITQKEKGFALDVFGGVTIGVQSAQREEGNFSNLITNYRGGFPLNEQFTQNGNSANGGTDIQLGVRAGRKHSPAFEYSVQADLTFKTARDYEVLRAFAQNNFATADLEFNEDAQLIFHLGATAQFLLGDVAALYGGADFFFNGARELNTAYPTGFNERTDIDSKTGFGVRLGVKFLIVPKRFTIDLEGRFISFTDTNISTFVNNVESFRTTRTDDIIIGGTGKLNFFF